MPRSTRSVEAIDDLDYERRYGEPREAASQRVEEVRSILEELLPESESDGDEPEPSEEHEGLTVVEADELAREAS